MGARRAGRRLGSPACPGSARRRNTPKETLTFAEAFASNEGAVTVVYTKPGTNPLRDTTGNDVATFTALNGSACRTGRCPG